MSIRYREMQLALIDAQNFLRDWAEVYAVTPQAAERWQELRNQINSALGDPSLADIYRIRKAAGVDIYTGKKEDS